MNIDWQSSSNHVLLNPRFHSADVDKISELAKQGSHLRGHLFLATSGSTRRGDGEIKLVALSKLAILASAAAVNQRIQSGPSDIWIHTLPFFHVGGLAIWARSYLSGARVLELRLVDVKWNPTSFHQRAQEARGTLVSLVPAQVYDLVQLRLTAPPYLRAVIVGGGRLAEQIYLQARELGWNLIPTYGMTECSSQIATAELATLEKYEYPGLKLLECFVAQIDSATGCLRVKGDPLLTGYCQKTGSTMEFIDPKQDGWFVTEDYGTIRDGYVAIKERRQDFVKISGESVNLARLDQIIEEIKLTSGFGPDLALTIISDERLGYTICLAVAAAPSAEVDHLVVQYNSRVLPFERIRQIRHLDEIPRTALGKLIRRMEAWEKENINFIDCPVISSPETGGRQGY